jgi:hypothetical protein
MRIIIEGAQTRDLAQAAALQEGGAPSGRLLEALGGAASGQPAEQAGMLQDAGPPSNWLGESIRKAFEQDPGRFEFEPFPEGEGGAAGGALDGGSAPGTARP